MFLGINERLLLVCESSPQQKDDSLGLSRDQLDHMVRKLLPADLRVGIRLVSPKIWVFE